MCPTAVQHSLVFSIKPSGPISTINHLRTRARATNSQKGILSGPELDSGPKVIPLPKKKSDESGPNATPSSSPAQSTLRWSALAGQFKSGVFSFRSGPPDPSGA